MKIERGGIAVVVTVVIYNIGGEERCLTNV